MSTTFQLTDKEEILSLAKAISDPRTGIEVQDRKYRLRTYRQCFVGSSAVTWIVVHKKVNRNTAVLLGQQMMDDGYFVHVSGEHAFEDQKLFYRFTKKISTIGSIPSQPLEKERTHTVPTVPMSEIQNRLGPVKNTGVPMLPAKGSEQSSSVPTMPRSATAITGNSSGPQAVSRQSILARRGGTISNPKSSASGPPVEQKSEAPEVPPEAEMEQPKAFVNTPLQQIAQVISSNPTPVLSPVSSEKPQEAQPASSLPTQKPTIKPTLKQHTLGLKPNLKQGKPAVTVPAQQGKPSVTEPTKTVAPAFKPALKQATPFVELGHLPKPKELPVQLAHDSDKPVPAKNTVQQQMEKSVPSAAPVGSKSGEPIQISNLETGESWKAKGTGDYFDCRKIQCHSGLLKPKIPSDQEAQLENKDHVMKEAMKFLEEYNTQFNISGQAAQSRIQQVKQSIQSTGTYTHTPQELTFGARMAWRNAPKCIGRLVWSKLQVLDRRDCTTPSQIHKALVDHLKFATNNGNIVTTISIFPQKPIGKPGYKIWNSQLIRYAGYHDNSDDSIIGDPSELEMTKWAKAFGWNSSQTSFDILPWLIQAPGENPQLFHIPDEAIIEVPISHPKHSWFAELGYRWYSIPSVSNMGLTIGGVVYTCAPFSNWYMLSDLVKNFSDTHRYNQLPAIANELNLDLSSNSTLWKDEALLELSKAVLYSFNKHKIALVDHHTASEAFAFHFNSEMEKRGEIACDARALIPSLASCTTSIYNLEMLNFYRTPAFFPQKPAWTGFDLQKIKRMTVAANTKRLTSLLSQKKDRAILILFSSRNNKARYFAERIEQSFLEIDLNVTLYNALDFDPDNISLFETVIIVASTYSGEPPYTGSPLKLWLEEAVAQNQKQLNNITYAVFGLGSRVYPQYCEFARFIDESFEKLGARSLLVRGEADEVSGQEKTFLAWKGLLKYELLTDLNLIKEDLASERGAAFSPQYSLSPVTTIPEAESHLMIAPIKSQTELLTDKEKKSTQHVVLDISNYNIEFQPGDNLAVLPENDSKLVATTLKKLAVKDPNEKVQLTRLRSISAKETHRFPPASVADVLSKHIDLHSPPSPFLLNVFSNYTNDPNEKTELIGMSQGGSSYREWIKVYAPCIVDVFLKFPHLQVPLEVFLETAPLMVPRLYAIASSCETDSTEISIVVSVVSYYSQSQEARSGIASTFLTQSKVGTNIRCWVESNPSFKLPNDGSPLVMITAGTGIAPFRSFWQQRTAQILKGKGDEIGPAILVYGCRDPDNQLFADQSEEAIQSNALTSVFTAYSRFGLKRQYVQNIIEKESAFATLILEHNAHIYVSGDIELAKGVSSALEFLLETQGVEKKESADYLTRLRKEGRYQENIFGLMFNFAEKSENFARLFERQPLTAYLKAEKRETVALASTF